MPSPTRIYKFSKSIDDSIESDSTIPASTIPTRDSTIPARDSRIPARDSTTPAISLTRFDYSDDVDVRRDLAKTTSLNE
ncbi:hypothetical protein F2Q69_00050352 [Brassica cretica]|uniref:Uncharacterized protein n=1 Tax=Brassica cretica TaxID=69181 RepID=A0A8S9PSP8_BRACR|nr:hypothetical protein F2Q69_00050352 [Brassica cretica]